MISVLELPRWRCTQLVFDVLGDDNAYGHFSRHCFRDMSCKFWNSLLMYYIRFPTNPLSSANVCISLRSKLVTYRRLVHRRLDSSWCSVHIFPGEWRNQRSDKVCAEVMFYFLRSDLLLNVLVVFQRLIFSCFNALVWWFSWISMNLHKNPLQNGFYSHFSRIYHFASFYSYRSNEWFYHI